MDKITPRMRLKTFHRKYASDILRNPRFYRFFAGRRRLIEALGISEGGM